ncbi:MAG: hypothetical protein VB835_01120 [Pirellulales bacterium]
MQSSSPWLTGLFHDSSYKSPLGRRVRRRAALYSRPPQASTSRRTVRGYQYHDDRNGNRQDNNGREK